MPLIGDPTQSRPLRCPKCGKLLAAEQGGIQVVKHAGRNFAALLLVAPCDRKGCEGEWVATDADQALIDRAAQALQSVTTYRPNGVLHSPCGEPGSTAAERG